VQRNLVQPLVPIEDHQLILLITQVILKIIKIVIKELLLLRIQVETQLKEEVKKNKEVLRKLIELTQLLKRNCNHKN
jgi:hypothetical protein